MATTSDSHPEFDEAEDASLAASFVGWRISDGDGESPSHDGMRWDEKSSTWGWDAEFPTETEISWDFVRWDQKSLTWGWDGESPTVSEILGDFVGWDGKSPTESEISGDFVGWDVEFPTENRISEGRNGDIFYSSYRNEVGIGNSFLDGYGDGNSTFHPEPRHLEGEVAPPRYSNQQKILLVGEGDFSFSSCLADFFISASNITATSLDSRETVVREYCKGEGHLRNLAERGAVVIHQVDAGTMDAHPQLQGKLFDRIIFNFPHAGGTYFGVKEGDSWYIEMHRWVVRLFFGAARKMLAEEGEVHVSHKRGYPYYRWNIVELARENAGLMLAREAEFRTRDYPGYENKKGYGSDWNRTFPVEDASVFIFCCKT